MASPDPRPTLAAPDDDPYLWLEEVEGRWALAWVEAQNAATLRRFGDSRFMADRDGLTAILDRPDNLPFIRRRGSHVYNFWRDAVHPRGLWRRTTLPQFRTEAPSWETVLDLDALAAAEGEDWVWSGASTFPGAHHRAVLRLSRGGGDAVVLRELDLDTGTFVADGFTAPEAKGGVAWLDRDTLLLSSALGGGAMTTAAGLARTVRLWRRGTDPHDTSVVFAVDADHMVAWSGIDRSGGSERIWFADRSGFFEAVVWLGNRDGPTTRIDLPSDARFSWHRDWLSVAPRTPWTVGDATHPPDTLLGIGFDAFLAGDRRLTPLFTPAERRTLSSFFWSGGRLILGILDDLRPTFEALTPAADGWARTAIKGLPQIGVANLWSLDIEDDESTDELLASTQDPLTPPSLSLLRPGAAPTILKRAPAVFDAAGLVVTRHEAAAEDGERIPYVQVGPASETGDAPVHVTGYGGFGVSTLPYYRSGVGKLWLERGGTAIIAQIRGGGEFGTPWHDAGRRAHKRRAHDDFAAVAADLVRRGVTRPERIAAEGASNGGLLIANMLTRYPERFGALFCTIPLTDMRRYAKLLAGASWVQEYGDPAKPEDWAFLQNYSAYHLSAPDQTYPPILLATTRKDDRVHPAHARKLAAKLQALGYEAHFYEPATGGHGYGKNNSERAAFAALGYSFLRRAIGWEAGDA